jgi:hypothetical protein
MMFTEQTIVNLAEQQGKEAAVTNAYKEYAQELDLKDIMWVSISVSWIKC